MKKITLIIFCFLFKQFCFGQCSEETSNNLRKTAIVFGEKDYQYAEQLTNPLNDAEDISKSLKKLGFEVVTYNNTDVRTMKNAIDVWCSKIDNYDVALFYYSGHGAEVNGENFIFPIDANPIAPSDLNYVAYPTNKILGRMEFAKTKVNIMILDACRNNPFTRKWKSKDFTPSNGLATMSAKGSFIGFAASPGYIASDGEGRNGTYTEAILNNIEIPNLSIDQIFTRVNSDVRKRSSEKQIPFKNSSLNVDFCFNTTQLKNLDANEKDKTFAFNIKSLLHKVAFNSSISDVINFEFGTTTNSITYESLPTATECSNEIVKYYWRYLNESKLKTEIYSYLFSKDLKDKVSNDSYVIYAFKDNKLVRISLRIFPLSYDFNSLFVSSLGQNISIYPNKYQTKVDGLHYASGSSFTDIASTEIFICNEVGYQTCIHDWWHK